MDATLYIAHTTESPYIVASHLSQHATDSIRRLHQMRCGYADLQGCITHIYSHGVAIAGNRT